MEEFFFWKSVDCWRIHVEAEENFSVKETATTNTEEVKRNKKIESGRWKKPEKQRGTKTSK